MVRVETVGRNTLHLPKSWRRAGDTPGRQQLVCLLQDNIWGECHLLMGTLWCQVRNSDELYYISTYNIQMIGGRDPKSLSDVLDYDPDADKWTKVGQLAKARTRHAMSLVPKEIADYCV